MNLLFSIFSLFLLVNCGTKDKTKGHNEFSKSETKKITVSGTVSQTYSYCGGARPSDEMIAGLATPKPWPGKKFHIIKGDTNTVSHKVVLDFTSDAEGKFSFELEPGTYSIILDDQLSPPDAKKYKTELINVDETCFNNWWAKPYYLLEVKEENIKDLNFNFHHRCFIGSDVPCLHYTGPYPP